MVSLRTIFSQVIWQPRGVVEQSVPIEDDKTTIYQKLYITDILNSCNGRTGTPQMLEPQNMSRTYIWIYHFKYPPTQYDCGEFIPTSPDETDNIATEPKLLTTSICHCT